MFISKPIYIYVPIFCKYNHKFQLNISITYLRIIYKIHTSLEYIVRILLLCKLYIGNVVYFSVT